MRATVTRCAPHGRKGGGGRGTKDFRPILCLALLSLLLSSLAASAQARDRREEERDLHHVTKPPYGLVSALLDYPRRGDLQRAADICAELNGKPAGELTHDDVVRLYSDVHYDTVRAMADHGINYNGTRHTLNDETSRRLAILRDEMINETYKQMVREYGIEFVRLDFGNKESGLRSDVDHTGFTDFQAERFKGLSIREEFAKRFELLWKTSQESCDVVMHSGENRIPDWRGVETVAEFDAKMVDVLRGLAGTPDAYVEEGPWRMQIEGRSFRAVEEVLRNLRDLNLQLDRAGLSEAEQADIHRRMRDAEEANPCTRFLPGEREGDEPRIMRDTDVLRRLFAGIDPKVLTPYAFDVAVGNYLFHLHYVDPTDCPKYLLRSFEEGVCLLRRLDAGETLAPLEWAGLAEARKTQLVDELYRDFTPEQRRTIRHVLDIASKLRKNHKLPPDAQMSRTEIWGNYMKHLQRRSKVKGRIPDDQLLNMANLEYQRASTQVMVWSIQRAAEARYKAWLSPQYLNETDFNLLGKLEPGLTREKFQIASYWALKRAFAELPEEVANRLVEDAPEHVRRNVEVLRGIITTERKLFGRVRIQPEERDTLADRLRRTAEDVKRTWARSYDDFWRAAADGHYSDEAISNRVLGQVYDYLGYEWKLVHDKLEGEATQWDPQWNPYKLFRNFCSSGNILSALQVLQVYQVTGGDREATIAALIWEGLYNVPGVAHIFAFRDAWYGNYHGLKFLISARVCQMLQTYAHRNGIHWAAPFGANILIYITIAKTAVEVAGHAAFTPVVLDAADFMYLGRVGPTTPPEEFTDEQEDRLGFLRRRLVKNQKQVTAFRGDKSSAQWQELVNTLNYTKGEIRKLERIEAGWTDYRRRAERWEAGVVQAGWTKPVFAQYEPVLHRLMPMEFFFGPLEDDRGDPVNLEAKALTEDELDHLDRKKRKLQGLLMEAQGYELPERIELILALEFEIELAEEQHREGLRADRYRRKFRDDAEWAIKARRQNVYHLLEPELRQRMVSDGYPPEETMKDRPDYDWGKYYEHKEQVLPEVIDRHVREWYDRCHSQVRNLYFNQRALEMVKQRTLADYMVSERLMEAYEDWELHKHRALRARQEYRRAFLENLAARDALTGFLEGMGRENVADYGLLVLTRQTPPAKPIVRFNGTMHEEGDEPQVHFEVKVIASPMHYQPPYTVKSYTKINEDAAGGVKEGTIVAEVYDANDVLVGSKEIPFKLTETGEKQEVAAAKDWLFPPKILAKLTPLEGDERDEQLTIDAYVSGAPVGNYVLEAQIGPRTYTLLGSVRRPGESLRFESRQIPFPAGTHEVQLRLRGVQGVPPTTFTIRRSRLQSAGADFAEAKREYEEARRQVAALQGGARRRAIDDLLSAAPEYADGLREREEYRAAIQVLQEALRYVTPQPQPDATSREFDIHYALAWIAFRGGNRDVMLASSRFKIECMKRTIAGSHKKITRRNNGALNAYDDLIERYALLGGDMDEARRLWSERCAYAESYYGRTAVPEPRPDWWPE